MPHLAQHPATGERLCGREVVEAEGYETVYWANVQWNSFKHIGTWNPNMPEATGDINGDGAVDVDDLNIIINIMLRKATLEHWPAADIDGSGIVDIDDLNHVINIMVGKE
ncbi:MAG: dockerin type I repeat-containing protein [Muribaculaceae bacterium]|nr:dockerin type I repeat-containing protein [Muribaculaceae bacterium]